MSVSVPGLRDRTRYRVLVTSIDNTGDESPTGRTLSFNTENRPPEYPFPVSCEYIGSGGAVRLSWMKTLDPDGAVTGYRIYRRTQNGPALLGSTDKTEFEAKGLPSAEKHYFTVRSVDNRGGESSDSYPASTRLVRYANITASGAFLLPMGDYGRLYRPGWGGTVTVSAENLVLDRMALGVETGCWYFSGRTDVSRDAFLVPVRVVASYRAHLSRWFSLDPSVGAGGCYNTVSANAAAVVPAGLFFLKRYARVKAFEFIFSAGAQGTFTISKTALVSIGCAYNGIIERGGLMSVISVHAGAGVRI
jgi:hypothetical protein